MFPSKPLPRCDRVDFYAVPILCIPLAMLQGFPGSQFGYGIDGERAEIESVQRALTFSEKVSKRLESGTSRKFWLQQIQVLAGRAS